MKVYIVWNRGGYQYGDCQIGGIYGVFSTREKAEMFIANGQFTDGYLDWEEREVDEKERE